MLVGISTFSPLVILYRNLHLHSVQCDSIEKNSSEDIIAERVYLEYFDNDANKKDFEKFNSWRETVFNFTMEQLGLDFRFKCVQWPIYCSPFSP